MPRNKSMKESIQKLMSINATITKQFGKRHSRSLKVTSASSIANIFVGSGKLLFGIVSMSFFTCVSAFYTFGMVTAKVIILRGLMKSTKEQYHYYSLAGSILIFTSLVYSGYSLRLFFYPVTILYDMNIAIGIATFTFIEIGIGIRGVLMERHEQTLLIHALKMINLASALISLVLTQTAILSFSDTQLELQPKANGIFGFLIGICAALLGISMLVRIRQIQRGTNYHSTYRKVKKIMKKEQISCKIKAVRYQVDNQGNTLLFVKYISKVSKIEIDFIKTKVKEQVQIQLIDSEQRGRNK